IELLWAIYSRHILPSLPKPVRNQKCADCKELYPKNTLFQCSICSKSKRESYCNLCINKCGCCETIVCGKCCLDSYTMCLGFCSKFTCKSCISVDEDDYEKCKSCL